MISLTAVNSLSFQNSDEAGGAIILLLIGIVCGIAAWFQLLIAVFSRKEQGRRAMMPAGYFVCAISFLLIVMALANILG